MDRKPEHRSGRQQNSVPFQRTTYKTASIFPTGLRSALLRKHDHGHRLPVRHGLPRQPTTQLGVPHPQLDSQVQEVHFLLGKLYPPQREFELIR